MNGLIWFLVFVEPVAVLKPPVSSPPEMTPPPVNPQMPPAWQMQPSGPKNLVMPLPPKVNDTSLDLTPSINRSSVVASQPAALVPKLGDVVHGVLTSCGGNKKGIWLQTGRLLLAAALPVFLASTKH